MSMQRGGRMTTSGATEYHDHILDDLADVDTGGADRDDALMFTGRGWQPRVPQFRINMIDNGEFKIRQEWNQFGTATGEDMGISGGPDRWQGGRKDFASGGYIAQLTGVQLNDVYDEEGALLKDRFRYGCAIKHNGFNTTSESIRMAQVIDSALAQQAYGKHLTLSFYAWASPTWTAKGGALRVSVFAGNETGGSFPPYGQPNPSTLQEAWYGIETVLEDSIVITEPNLARRYVVHTDAPVGDWDSLGVIFEWWPNLSDGEGNVYPSPVDNFCGITGVQLELGKTASPFIRKPYSQELAIARSWKRVIKSVGVDKQMPSNGISISTTEALITLRHEGMRRVPYMKASYMDQVASYAPLKLASDTNPLVLTKIGAFARDSGNEDYTNVLATLDTGTFATAKQFQQLYAGYNWQGAVSPYTEIVFTTEF